MRADVTMKTLFEQENDLIELEGNQPLLLSGRASVYRVESGSVDIFCASMRRSESFGSRSHLVRVHEGDMIFGVMPPPGKMGMIAVGGPGTRAFRMDIDDWRRAAVSDSYCHRASRRLADWIEHLGRKVGGRAMPLKARRIRKGNDIAVNSGELLMAEHEPLWVSHRGSRSIFMGITDIPSIQTDDPVPVTADIWLDCISTGVVDCIDNRDFLQRISFGDDLARFHELILQCVVVDMGRSEVQERNRLARKATQDGIMMESALLRLDSVLRSGRAGHAEAGSDDELLSCCQIIGGYADISFKEPAEASSGAPGAEPLAGICRASGVRHRKVVLGDGWWKMENGPILAYGAEDGRPVALIPGDSRGYRIYHPGSRAPETVDRQAAESLKAEAYMFYRPFPERAMTGREFLSFGLKNCAGDLRMILLLGFSTAILGLLTPIVTGIIFDSVIPSAAESQLLQIVFLLTICALTTSLFDITRGIAQIRVESRMDISLQAAVWDRLLSLPPPFFRNYSSGDLAFRSLGVNYMRQILSGVTVTAILGGLFSLVNFALLFYYDWKLGLLATGLALTGFIFTCWASYYKVRYERKVSALQSKIYGAVLQFITGIAKLRVSGAENRAFSSWTEKFTEQKKMAYKAGKIDCTLLTFNSVFPVMASMTIFSWVAFKSMGSLSAGDFLAFNTAYINFQTALLQMGVALASSLTVVPYYERLKPIIEEAPETDAAKADPGELTGDIEVRHVNFRYGPEDPLVLENVSLNAEPVEFIALVGSSGSGKSTLLRLLLGFENPESGTIYYDQQDLASLEIREVRHQIGVVLQNSQLMAGDIYQNIVGATNLGMEDAWAAVRMAGMEDDIKKMPMGMLTVIGAGGGTLSGGQRQRLLVTRAIANKPRLLFFDEATSALDNRTQEVVTQSLQELKVTRIVIAHRLSTIINADRIYVLDSGRIVQNGTYDELINTEGPFTDLVKRQL